MFGASVRILRGTSSARVLEVGADDEMEVPAWQSPIVLGTSGSMVAAVLYSQFQKCCPIGGPAVRHAPAVVKSFDLL